jgi:hypothetical protein
MIPGEHRVVLSRNQFVPTRDGGQAVSPMVLPHEDVRRAGRGTVRILDGGVIFVSFSRALLSRLH